MACLNPFDYRLATGNKIKLRKDAYDCGIICKFYVFSDMKECFAECLNSRQPEYTFSEPCMDCVKANLPCAEANCFFPCTPIFGSPKKCHECLFASECKKTY